MNLNWTDLWGLLPLAVFGGLARLGYKRDTNLPSALARATMLWAASSWVGANALGLFGALGAGGVRAWWLACALVVWLALRREPQRRPFQPPRTWLRPRGTVEWLLASACASLLLLAGVVAIIAPPATVDVLNYHLPRQLMWLQQGGLAHFTTLNDRMLMMPPLSEVISLQFLALTGDDHWVNLPQWFAYALSPLLAATAARRLGGGRIGAWSASWLFITLPMAWHEASNAKNDLQATLWLLIVLLEVLDARQGAPPSARAGLRAGAAIGLALLNKSTAFLFLPPLIVAGVCAWATAGAWPRAARTGGIALLAALLLVAPFFGRNLAWYGTPLGSHAAEEGGEQFNDAFGPKIWISNFLRTGTLHAAAPWPGWNKTLDHAVRRTHMALGLDVDDPRTTFWITRYSVDYAPEEETQAGAPWHALALVIALGASLFARGREARQRRWLALSILVMGATWVVTLRWQPWASRLHLPVFGLGVVLVVAWARHACGWRHPARLGGLALAFGLLAWWPSRQTSLRPLWRNPTIFELDRVSGMHRHLPELQGRDQRALRLIQDAGVRETTLLHVQDSVYPLMRLLLRESPGFVLRDGSGAPPESVLVCDHFRVPPIRKYWGDGTAYRLVGDVAGDALYLPPSLIKRLGWTERLPPYAGWSSHTGLSMVIAPRSGDAPQPIWRRIDRSRGASVFFHAEKSGPVSLGITLAGFPSGSSPALVRLNGGLLELPPPRDGRLVLDGMIQVQAGQNELAITSPTTEEPSDLDLLRLQIGAR